MGKGVVNRIVIVPHNCHKNHKMAGHKYDHRIKSIHGGCGVVERHLEMAKPTKSISWYKKDNF